MKRKLVLALMAAPVAGLISASFTLTTAETDEPSMVREMAGLNRSLQSIAEVLERIERKQDVVLVLRRIEAKERRLLPRESALRSERSSIQGLRTDYEQIRSYYDGVLEQMESLVREGPVDPEREAMLADLRREETEAARLLKVRKEEIEERERTVLEMEDDLEDLRDEVAVLEELLERLLGDG